MSISEKPLAAEDAAAGERSRWPILQQPRGLIVYMGLLLFTALFLFGAAAALTTVTLADVVTFLALTMCAGICVEAIRRLGVPAGFARDLLGAWWFPVVLLLPPVYSLIVPIPVFLLLQLRARRALAHRRVFNATAIGLSGFLASVVWHRVAADGLWEAMGGASEAHDSLATGAGVLIAVLCCAGFTVLNTLLVALAARISMGPGATLRPMWDREACTVDAVELCVGVTVAILAQLTLFLLAIAVPPVLLLQRSLLFQQLQMAARTDPKTGLLNAPTWEQEASVEIARARAQRGYAAVLIIDIDHFKRVNDNHGHLFGDQVLLGVATTIAQQLRQSDLLGRFGGEEFVVLLPGADTSEAWQAAERLRSQVGCMEISVDDVPVSITVSVGAAVIGEHGNDLVELLTAADLALYRAKETGRNRVCLPAGRPGAPNKIPGPREGGGLPGRGGPVGEVD
ncbi:GGDEF domain-containing protein [Nocardiopsis sp. EMB25]|uniref:sensor domain-containing diguanylate cyclase n=1 Tax=Nocardiopsis sp. EMB25 TaxID=2835867 RepID=UPI0022839EF2|nr:GGDEF domain-containing protein [Nocardiopsis sp. EMB25]MCY9785143.1 GGDEF domain-containing protein [Nocardiopsis sp. EMB25]